MSKEFTIENEYLKLTVTTWGAQVRSVVRKCDGVAAGISGSDADAVHNDREDGALYAGKSGEGREFCHFSRSFL